MNVIYLAFSLKRFKYRNVIYLALASHLASVVLATVVVRLVRSQIVAQSPRSHQFISQSGVVHSAEDDGDDEDEEEEEDGEVDDDDIRQWCNHRDHISSFPCQVSTGGMGEVRGEKVPFSYKMVN